MHLYRITRKKYLENYDGKGKSYQMGARWNQGNSPILYFASSPSVALLEIANYLPSPKFIPADYKLGIYHLPDSVTKTVISTQELTADWDRFPYLLSTQVIGDRWLKECQTLILEVPSVTVPDGLENCFVLNPLHPEIKLIKLIDFKDQLYNPRMFQGIN